MDELEVACPQCGNSEFSQEFDIDGSGWGHIIRFSLNDKHEAVIAECNEPDRSYDEKTYYASGFISCDTCEWTGLPTQLVVELPEGVERPTLPGPGQLDLLS